MEKLGFQSIKSHPQTHFLKLNNVFSIFIYIIFFSSTVSLYSYTQRLSIYTDYNDRNVIFLICNGILAFLFLNFESTHVSSPQENQSVNTYEIKHQNILISSAIEEQREKIEEYSDEIKLKTKRVCVPYARDSLSTIEDKSVETEELEEAAETGELEEAAKTGEFEEAAEAGEFEEAAETGELEEAAKTGEFEEDEETEELNKKCAEFIRKNRDRMKFESSNGRNRLLHSTETNSRIYF